jgi:biofilm PGA synthesis protein PgaA
MRLYISNKVLKKILIFLIAWSFAGIIPPHLKPDPDLFANVKISKQSNNTNAQIKLIKTAISESERSSYAKNRRTEEKSLSKQVPPSYPDPETSLTRAKELINEGKYKDALSLLAPFITDPMKHPTIFSDYLAILVWDGRYDDAIGLYEHLPPSFPRRAYLMRNIAKAYYEKKNYPEAFSLYDAVLKESPSDEEAQKGFVFTLVKMGDYSKAFTYTEKFLEKYPDSIVLAFTKAELLLRQGNYLESLKTYRIIAARTDVEAEHVYRVRDDLIVSLPAEKRQSMLAELQAASQKDEITRQDYILVLILSKEYKVATQVFEDTKTDLDRYTGNLLCWVAWACFKTGNTEKAKSYYQTILSVSPHHVQATIGLAYCLALEGQPERAIELLDRLQLKDQQNLEIRFARAFVYERSGKFPDAVKEYDRILEASPENPVAFKLKIQDLSDLGASSLALQEAYSDLPHDSKFHDSLKSDMAVDRIHWKEPLVAISILQPLMEDRDNMRARYDYIESLAENNDMELVVKVYEDLIKDGVSPPPWVLENVARAYLYLEEPHKALELYNKALEANPTSFTGRLGKFYTLQELRKWKEAKEVLDSLDRELPEVVGEGAFVRPNWPKLGIAIDRGWSIMYEERYREAEDYFLNLYENAPANTGIRTGLAHVYLWRGWPRKALREFEIIETLDPNNYKALIGKAVALNELAYKEQARDLARKLITMYPKDKHVQRLDRMLKVDEMSEVIADFVYIWDEDGFEDIIARMSFFQPVSLYTTLYGSLLWQQSSDENQTRFYRRAGIGINHIFNSSWSVSQAFSLDYNTGNDFSSFTKINLNPNDYWSLSLSYETFSTAVPLRARVFGIESDKLEADVTYRESEWRSYRLSFSHMKFSDGNKREEALLGYEQGLFVKNNWKMRIIPELYLSSNSRDDAPYFNPDHDLNLSLTHMTEHTVWRIYDRAFVHRLFLTAGLYSQSGFSSEPVWTAHYQQEHDFSDTNSLLWGGYIARRSYDGNPVHEYSLYLTYTWRF